MANQQANHSRGLRETNKAAGAAIHRLKQLKQSISLPARLSPNKVRKRTIMSAGPSSLTSRCVTRHVARTATTKRKSKLHSIRLREEPNPTESGKEGDTAESTQRQPRPGNRIATVDRSRQSLAQPSRAQPRKLPGCTVTLLAGSEARRLCY